MHRFPCGRGEVFIGEKLEQIELDREKGVFVNKRTGKQVMGSVQATVEAPNLFLPLLGVNCNGKFIFGTCQKCIQKEQRSLCRHSSRERQLTDTWTTSEIEAAVRWGYTIVRIHEMYLYDEVRAGKSFFALKISTFIDVFPFSPTTSFATSTPTWRASRLRARAFRAMTLPTRRRKRRALWS